MRVGQLWNWLYVQGATEFQRMTNIAKEFRAELASAFTLSRPDIVTEQVSSDGARKWLLRLDDDKEIETVSFGKVTLDFKARTATVAGKPVQMTSREFDLLHFFLSREGEALERQEILNRVWGFDYFGTDRTVDNFINRLRQKLEPDPDKPRYFLTVRGVGYRFSRGS